MINLKPYKNEEKSNIILSAMLFFYNIIRYIRRTKSFWEKREIWGNEMKLLFTKIYSS